MKKIIKYIEKINEIFIKIHAFSIFALMLVVLYEVIMRYLFNAPTRWAYDTSWMIYSIVILGGAYVLQQEGHVRIDVIRSFYPEKAKKLFDVISFLLIICIPMIILTYEGVIFTSLAWMRNEKIQSSAMYFPAGPVKTLIPIGFCFVALQSIVEFLKILKKY